jgi:hypothetical protein
MATARCCQRIERIDRDPSPMTPNRRLPADRDRMLARLRHVTLGSAAAGVAGTMLFGALAAATYDGTDSTAASATTSDDAVAQIAVDDSTAGAADDSASTSADDGDALQATPAPAASSSTSGAHASTGGS